MRVKPPGPHKPGAAGPQPHTLSGAARAGGTWVACISCCQWRSRMAGFCSSLTARRDVIMFFTVLSSPTKASQVRISLSRDLTSLANFLQSISICSTLMFFHLVVFQSSMLVLTWARGATQDGTGLPTPPPAARSRLHRSCRASATGGDLELVTEVGQVGRENELAVKTQLKR